MKFKVTNRFKDTDGYVYEVGDAYPKSGKGAKKRLEELAKVHSKYNVAFIEEVEEDKE